jgi:hypothetical protein
MDNLFDLLIPIAFIAATFLFRGKKKPEEESEGEGTDPVPGEDLRKLQEEIRKRIEAARQNQGGSGGQEQQPAAPVQQPRPASVFPAPVAPVRPIVAPEPQQQRRYQETEFDKMRRQVAEARKRADEERRKAATYLEGQKTPVVRPGVSMISAPLKVTKPATSSFLREVVGELRDARSARKAVLFSEILGVPVGSRQPGETSALWSR